jgi:Family of unknown function (DUF6491)
MKNLYLITALVLGVGGVAQASPAIGAGAGHANFEQVQRIRILGRMDGWRSLDDRSIIVWATPFDPYLIELSRRSPDLRYTHTVGLTSSAGSVYEKFDSVIVHGIRYPIEAIYKLDRQSARTMKNLS